MAKLIKNGSSAIFSRDNVDNQFTGLGLKVRFSGLNVTIESQGLKFYDGLLSELLNSLDVAFTESELKTFIGSFNVGGGGVTIPQEFKTVYNPISNATSPFINANNDLDILDSIVYEYDFTADKDDSFELQISGFWYLNATNKSANFRLDVNGVLGAVFNIEPQDSNNIYPITINAPYNLTQGINNIKLRCAPSAGNDPVVIPLASLGIERIIRV